MAQQSQQKQRARKSGGASGQAQQSGCYVYGIFPGDIQLDTELTGIGDPPAKVKLVRSGDLAALVSAVSLTGPLGTPEDLRVHKEILDSSAAAVPVLPMRFGAVLTDEDAVVSELLEANHDEFAAALHELDGRAQYVVNGRYVEKAILAEIVSQSREAQEMQRRIKDADPDATRDARIRLGEIISEGVAARREADTRVLGQRTEGHFVAGLVREPTHELDAVHAAFLVEQGKEKELQQVIDDLAADWDGRVELRVLGPMAAYDFVGGAAPQASAARN